MEAEEGIEPSNSGFANRLSNRPALDARKGVQRVSNILAIRRTLAHLPAHGEEEEKTRVEALQGVGEDGSPESPVAGIVADRKRRPGVPRLQASRR